jgi:translation initiation factor 2D
VEVGEVFRPTIHVIPVFEAVGADPSKYYTAAEATGVVNEYVEKHNLIKKSDGSVVILDFTLCDALYKGTVKKGSTYPSEIHRRDLGSSFVGRMQAHHRVSRGAESVVRKGALKSVQIMTERRQGNKKVTRLTGIESFLVDADVLATELQKKFACSTSVTELPGQWDAFQVAKQLPHQ